MSKTVYSMYEPHHIESKSNGRVHAINTDKHQSYRPAIFAASESKLNTVLKSTKSAMEDIGLQWNPKKCSTIHVRNIVQVQDSFGGKWWKTSIEFNGDGIYHQRERRKRDAGSGARV